MASQIRIHGARTHNLRDVDVEIPLGQIVVVVGPSGSGKSSLVYGTLHALAQSAYLDGLSAYAQNMISRVKPPEVDDIEGLRPTISFGQGYGYRSSRSTVGTATEGLNLLRLLYSRLGQPSGLDAGDFSFNRAESACPKCHASGTYLTPLPERLLDFSRSLNDGAIAHRTYRVGGRYWNILKATGSLPMDVSLSKFTPDQIRYLLWKPSTQINVTGVTGVQKVSYEGIAARMMGRFKDPREGDRDYDKSFCEELPCDECHGTRLGERAREVAITDNTGRSVRVEEALQMELEELRTFLHGITGPVADTITKHLIPLLDRTINMGLGYLTLARGTNTLSGGELQRIKLAHEVNSRLGGIVYIVDEASTGLHYEESRAVYAALAALVERDNTVILIDHAPGALQIGQHVIELGPGGGTLGGTITYSGPADGYTGEHGRLFRAERKQIPVDLEDPAFDVIGRSNNLVGETVRIPKGRFVVLAGRSGSGKSSLARDIEAQTSGSQRLSQKDIGGSARSVIATYLGVFDGIRKAYAKHSGLDASVFSFNSKGGGACSECNGWGIKRVDMQFLEDVTEPCDVCEGQRFTPEILNIKVNGLSIGDVLNLTIDEAVKAFKSDTALRRPLEVAQAVGMGHLVLGQSTDTLSGGEAQRLRISAEISKGSPQIFILDEPTRGLGRGEVVKFLVMVNKLVAEGRTIIAIEHNPSVIDAADWVIEMGPGSGHAGGVVVAQGTPDQVRKATTLTGQVLRELCLQTALVYRRSAIAAANSEHFTSVAPSVRRAKS